jgi:aconitate hydratase
VQVKLRRADGRVEPIEATAAVETRLEVALLRAGGVIPSILQQTIRAQHTAAATD